MRFRRLKLSGFKSFVEPAELRIEPGLTGVVGPNGCGKSNLLEALRWVMGEGSAKSLRGGGMEDVIFAGTDRRAARDFAEVSLLIEDDGPDAADHEVTRRIERGAGSAYRIDGRDVRAKDVSLLFADAATGAHSPALVSQGRIGAVISAKPVERRQMLEEAAGIAGLHARRKDAEQKLRATETNLARLDEILVEQEGRAAQLRRQARVATRYRTLTAQIRLAEGRLLYSHWADADRVARDAGAEAIAATETVTRLGAALTQASEAQHSASGEVATGRAASASAREVAHALAYRLAAVRARIDSVGRRLNELALLDQQLAAERQREQALAEDACTALASLEAERSIIETRLANGEDEAARVGSALSAAEAEARTAEAALAGLLTREAAMKAERNVAGIARNTAQAHLDRLDQEERRLSAQAAELGDGTAECRVAAEAKAAGAQATRDQQAGEVAHSAAERARDDAADRRDIAETRLAAARAAFAAAQAEQSALSRALAQGGGTSLIDRVRAEPGFEQALAAALGDDLEAPVAGEGPRYWGGSGGSAEDPVLPPGTEPLAAHVEAPPELTRRLAQIGVLDHDDGRPLACGQRLVTRDGRMRRWDGFVAAAAGAAAAERLVRRNRLAELEAGRRDLELVLGAAQEEQSQISEVIAVARANAAHARAEIADSERRVREAARAGDLAQASLERLAGQRAMLAERRSESAEVRAAARSALETADAALAALPDAGALAAEIIQARASAGCLGQAVAEVRADWATLARTAASDRERAAAASAQQRAWAERGSAAERRLAEITERAALLASERDQLTPEPKRLDVELSSLEAQSGASEGHVAQALAAEREAEAALADLAVALAHANEALALARESRAGADARAQAQVSRRIEYSRVCGEKFECPPPMLPGKLGFDPVQPTDPSTESQALERLSTDRERLGPVNLVAESELAELDLSRLQGTAERDELHEAIHRLRGAIGSLNREGRIRLLAAYQEVDRHFRSLFTTLFDGGQAHLELVESDDPLEAGLEIMAQPPGKRLTALSLLSGGEQALTAVALIFALFLTNPAPICVLDEVDAPLDDANVERFCDLLERMSAQTDTRYLIVTHNAVTMSRMHRLYGVTMIEQGISRLVSVDLGGAETLLAAE